MYTWWMLDKLFASYLLQGIYQNLNGSIEWNNLGDSTDVYGSVWQKKCGKKKRDRNVEEWHFKLENEKKGSKTNTHQNEKFMQNISDYQIEVAIFPQAFIIVHRKMLFVWIGRRFLRVITRNCGLINEFRAMSIYLTCARRIFHCCI